MFTTFPCDGTLEGKVQFFLGSYETKSKASQRGCVVCYGVGDEYNFSPPADFNS